MWGVNATRPCHITVYNIIVSNMGDLFKKKVWCKLISHLPWLQALHSSTAVAAERSSPWLTAQQVIERVRQSIHCLVDIVLRPEVRDI